MTTQRPPNRVREALGKLYDQEPPYFREYLRRFKEDPTSRVFAPLADAYRRQGRLEEAIDICKKGLEHHPEFHGGRVALAKCYLDKKSFTEARDTIERVVSAAPENLLAQRLMGEACLGLNDRAAALHAFKMALLLSPNDVTLSSRVHDLEREAAAAPADKIDMMPIAGAVRAEEDANEDWGLPLAPNATGETLVAPELQTDDAKPFDLEALLSATDDGLPRDDDSFRIEHVSAIFHEEETPGEITTSTLGDLYFSQGQFDRALRIFEKIASAHPGPEIHRKINLCRVRLGVDEDALLRNRKIETLRAILKKNETPT